MSGDDLTPDQRIQLQARTALVGYRSGAVPLRRLIDDLDVVWNNLPTTEWSEEFRGNWWTLEQVYVVALDRGEIDTLPADAVAEIEEAIGRLERLVDAWPESPNAVA